MSSRICRTIGWGMPWSDFLEWTGLKSAEEAGDALHEIFETGDDARLTIPKEDITEHLRSLPSRGTIITERRLLATQFTQMGRVASPVGPATDLYTLVWNGDTVTTIVFFPNLSYREKWFRQDDDIDYAFERFRMDGDSDAEPRTILRWTENGHYPWTYDRMREDGTPVSQDEARFAEPPLETVPAVPHEIRWYLRTLGIMDETAVNELRPVIAQWWT
jgi:hypothetical protein